MESIPFNVPFQHLDGNSSFAERVFALLKDVYDGRDVSVDFHLAMQHVSNYGRKILEATCSIPVGYVAPYGGVARAAGGSPRAVGQIMASNPFAPLVPCHRVVSSDFTLGGYGGGLEAKLKFLKRESRGYSSERDIQVKGKTLRVYPAELVIRKVEKDKR